MLKPQSFATENNYGVVYKYATIITLGSGVFGFFIGVFNAIQTYEVYYNHLQEDLQGKSAFIGLCNSLVCFGAIVGCLICPCLYKIKMTYRAISVLNDIVGIIGCLIMMIDLTPKYLYIGRFICGIFSGVQSSIAQVYVKDISPSEVIGQVGTFNQLLITIGLAISFGLSFVIPQQYNFDSFDKLQTNEINQFVQDYKLNVQLIQLIPILILIIKLLLIFQIKLNPPYYNIKEYETYYTKIYHTENEMQLKMREIKHLLDIRNAGSGVFTSYSANREKSAANNTFWRRFIIGFILSSSSQLTGINIIIFYSNDIFQKMGSGQQAKLYTLVLGILQIVFTLISTKTIEKHGRRLMLIIGEFLIILGLGLISISSSYNIGLMSVGAICLHLLGFSLSFGPVVWIYLVEILEESYISIMSLNSWLFTILIGLGVPFLISYGGLYTTFLLFAGMNILILTFIYFYVVETKGKSFFQIQNEYNQIHTDTSMNVPHVELQ